MQKRKKIYAMLGLLAVLLAVTVAVRTSKQKTESVKASGEEVFSIDTEEAVFLSWSYDSESFSFTKEEGSWTYDEDEAFPVDDEKIQELLDVFSSFKAAFTIEDPEDLSQYGLKSPECTITIGTGDTEYTICLGSTSTMDEERYVTVGDGNVYLAAEDPAEEYETELSAFIKNDSVPEFGTVKEIEFSGSEEYEIVMDEQGTSYDPDDIYFTDGKALDTDLVNDYLDSMEDLQLEDYAVYAADDEDLYEMGLDEPIMSAQITYLDEDENENTFTLSVGLNRKELSEEEQDTEIDFENVTAYARVGDSGIIYVISTDDYLTLTENTYDDLRHQEVLTAPFDEVASISVLLDGESYSFTRDEEDESVWTDDEGSEIDISGLQSALTSLKSSGFTDSNDADKKEISLTVTLNDENSTSVTIGLYRYDGDSCIAAVNAEPVCFVSRSSAVEVIEAVNSLVLNRD